MNCDGAQNTGVGVHATEMNSGKTNWKPCVLVSNATPLVNQGFNEEKGQSGCLISFYLLFYFITISLKSSQFL